MEEIAQRVAARLRAAQEDTGISGADLAAKVAELTGKPVEGARRQYAHRWLSGAQPLVRVSDDLPAVCDALGLNWREVVAGAVRGQA